MTKNFITHIGIPTLIICLFTLRLVVPIQDDSPQYKILLLNQLRRRGCLYLFIYLSFFNYYIIIYYTIHNVLLINIRIHIDFWISAGYTTR